MCDGRIHRTQRFPANPVNGQVPVWNALTKKWEAQNQSGGGSLPPGSNPNDMLFWDATNLEWIVGAEVSGFNPSSDYSISGQLDYSNGLILSQTDPSSAFSPITGVSIFADTSDNFSVKRADGIRYSFSSAFLTTDRKFTFPDRDGKFAMSDFDNEFTVTQTFTQINNGRVGAAGKINWINDSGSLVAASGIVPGASNFFHEGNNFNFRTNATGFFFGSGSTWVNPTARLHVRGDGTNTRLETSIARRIFEADATTGRWLGDGASYITPYDYATGAATIASSTGFGINFMPGAVTVSHSINSAGTRFNFGTGGAGIWTLSSAGAETISGGALYFRTTMAPSAGNGFVFGNGGNFTWTNGTGSHVFIDSVFAASAGSGNFRPLSINYTINNTGAQTGTATGIFLNVTQTALNGMVSRLMDLQTDGVTRFSVGGTPTLSVGASSIFIDSSFREIRQARSSNTEYIGIYGNTSGYSSGLTLYGSSSVTAPGVALFHSTLVAFSGTTNLFPAIKRVNQILQFKLADDSALTRIEAEGLSMGQNGKLLHGTLIVQEYYDGATANNFSVVAHPTGGNQFFGFGQSTSTLSASSFFNMIVHRQGMAIQDSLTTPSSLSTSVLSSAVLQLNSTSRGFLLPRMTSAQRDAIAAPAEGLEIYNTTEKAKQFWNGIAWKTILTA